MPRELEVIRRGLIPREHPHWTWDQIAAVVQAIATGQGAYAIFAAGLLAANGGAIP